MAKLLQNEKVAGMLFITIARRIIVFCSTKNFRSSYSYLYEVREQQFSA